MFSYIDATSIRYVIYASRYDQISTRLSYSKKLKDKKRHLEQNSLIKRPTCF